MTKAENNNIPDGWTEKELGSIATLQRGKDLPKQNQVFGKYPIVGSSRIIGYHNQFTCEGPGVVTGRSGSIGNLTYIQGRYWAHNTGLYVKDFHANNEKFIFYLMHTLDFKRYATGVSVPTLNRNFIHSALLMLPPLPEQQKIAFVLSTIQEAKEKAENVILATKELKKSMMKHLFTYGPVPAEEAAKVSVKETEIGMIAEHWEIKRINEVCEKIIDCPHSTPKFIGSGVLCVRNYNLRDGRLILNKPSFTSEEEYKERIRRCEPIEGDVLFSREAPIGEACLIPSQTKLSLGQRMMLLRTDPIKLNNFYLVQTFYSKGIRKLMNEISSGVTAKHLNVADVRHLTIPLPPLAEQQEIAQIISNIDKKIEAEENKKDSLEALFKTLLSLLMTGEIRVKDLEIPA